MKTIQNNIYGDYNSNKITVSHKMAKFFTGSRNRSIVGAGRYRVGKWSKVDQYEND